MATSLLLMVVHLMQYWDDEADAIRVDEGTLLPLWRFESSSAALKEVSPVINPVTVNAPSSCSCLTAKPLRTADKRPVTSIII